jgi:hypothetical protein
MHKSIIIFFSLLVILLPLGTSNMNISVANAIPEDEYYVDQYENYAMDNMANDNYYKSQDRDFIKEIKCNNINANLNGDIDIGTSQALGALASDDEAQAADEGANGDGRSSGHDSNSRFVCINNNNNHVGKETEEEEEEQTCEGCFETTLTSDELGDLIRHLAGLDPEVANDLDEYCEVLSILEANLFTIEEIKAEMLFDFNAAGIDETQLDKVIECLTGIGFLTPP